jgi:hypothetical protein
LVILIRKEPSATVVLRRDRLAPFCPRKNSISSLVFFQISEAQQGKRLISRKASLGLLVLLTLVVAAICCMLPRTPLPLAYHLFADRRGLFGIPNFGDVAYNLPFAVVGIWGLVFLRRTKDRERLGEANGTDRCCRPGRSLCEFDSDEVTWPAREWC